MSDSDEALAAGRQRGDLTEQQRRVRLEDRLLTHRVAPADTRILPRAEGERCPLSLTQQRLWFLDQLFPGSPAYNEPTALRLEGKLDSASLSRALDEIVARHEALRTVFALAEGEPYQVVQPPRPLDLEPLDLSALEDAARDGDRVYAVLRGIAGSSDGKSLGLTAPRKEGQKLAIEREERHLQARFGETYLDYARRVRRWI